MYFKLYLRLILKYAISSDEHSSKLDSCRWNNSCFLKFPVFLSTFETQPLDRKRLLDSSLLLSVHFQMVVFASSVTRHKRKAYPCFGVVHNVSVLFMRWIGKIWLFLSCSISSKNILWLVFDIILHILSLESCMIVLGYATW